MFAINHINHCCKPEQCWVESRAVVHNLAQVPARFVIAKNVYKRSKKHDVYGNELSTFIGITTRF
jgi:hypothetical protein